MSWNNFDLAKLRASLISWDPPLANIDGILEDLDYVEGTWRMVKATIADAEEREIWDDSIRLWLRELRDLAYMMEDVHDLYEYQLAANEAAIERGRSPDIDETGRRHLLHNTLSKAFSHYEVNLPLQDPSFWMDVSIRVGKIKKKLADIAKKKEALSLREVGARMGQNDDVTMSFTYRQSSGCLVQSNLVGREQELLWLRETSLLEEGEGFEVIAIVGMGGAGKTCLAQHLFEHLTDENKFDIMGWVSVSENFDLVRVMKETLEAFTNREVTSSVLSVLQSKLQVCVRDQRFFLVMDDMWNTQYQLWDAISAPFMRAGNGSKILITTREVNVAKTAGATKGIQLDCLDEEDGWSLFRQYAFLNPDEEQPREFVDMGKEIVMKCGGLPLAVKVLGSSLRYSNGDADEWRHVIESNLWDPIQLQIGQQILGSLYFSYIRLPPYLKACFRFCSLFERGERIRRGELSELWMTHNLITVPKGGCSLYETADWYIDELLSMSFFEYASIPWRLGESGIRIHDLLFDILQYISGYEFSSQWGWSSPTRHVRLLKGLKNHPTIDATNLRTLAVGIHEHIDGVSTEVSSGSSLRLLNVSRCDVLKFDELLSESLLLRTLVTCHAPNSLIKLYNLRHLTLIARYDVKSASRTFPEAVCALKKLIFLNVESSYILYLPESISELTNLEVLDLRRCDSLQELPRGITKLTKLQFLLIGRTRIRYIPSGISRLKHLRDLDRFPVGSKDEDGHAGITELKNARLKCSEFIISNLENVTVEEAKEFGMASKQIHDLRLDWSSESRETEADEALLEVLRPHPVIGRLSIHGYGGSDLPTWTCDESFRLTKVRLSHCRSIASISSLERLPFLWQLDVYNMSALTEIISVQTSSGCPDCEQISFPRLGKLSIVSCARMEYVPVYRFPSLVKFHITSCEQISKIDFFMDSSSSSASQEAVSYLTYVAVKECPHLSITSVESLQRLPFLEHLFIAWMPSLTEQAFIPSHQDKLVFPKLEYLGIQYCEKIKFVPQPVLVSSLRSLYVCGSEDLASWVRSNRDSVLARVPDVYLNRYRVPFFGQDPDPNPVESLDDFYYFF